MSSENEGQFMPCPVCGLSVAITDDAATAALKAPLVEPTKEESAYLAQLNASQQFAATKGCRRVAYRVFRLSTLETWETIFDRAASFANTLPPEALINISHSGGDGIGTHAATVWYWEVMPVSDRRIRAILGDDATDNAPTS